MGYQPVQQDRESKAKESLELLALEQTILRWMVEVRALEAPTQAHLLLVAVACLEVEVVGLVAVTPLSLLKPQVPLAGHLACSLLVEVALLERLGPPQLLDLPEPMETATEAVVEVEVVVQPWRRLQPVSPVALEGVVAVVAVAVAVE